jgi:hypothetical protein
MTPKADGHRLDFVHVGADIYPRCSCGFRSVHGFATAGLAAVAWSEHRVDARLRAAESRAAYMRQYRAGAS